MADNLTDEQVISSGMQLAHDVLLAQRLGRMPQMLPVINEAPPAALSYALMYVVAMTDQLALHAARGDKRKALDLIRTPTRTVRDDIAGTIRKLDDMR